MPAITKSIPSPSIQMMTGEAPVKASCTEDADVSFPPEPLPPPEPPPEPAVEGDVVVVAPDPAVVVEVVLVDPGVDVVVVVDPEGVLVVVVVEVVGVVVVDEVGMVVLPGTVVVVAMVVVVVVVVVVVPAAGMTTNGLENTWGAVKLLKFSPTYHTHGSVASQVIGEPAKLVPGTA